MWSSFTLLAQFPASHHTVGVHRWWISVLEELILGHYTRQSINKILRMTETFQGSTLWFKLLVNGRRMCSFWIKKISVGTSYPQNVINNYNGRVSLNIHPVYTKVSLHAHVVVSRHADSLYLHGSVWYFCLHPKTIEANVSQLLWIIHRKHCQQFNRNYFSSRK